MAIKVSELEQYTVPVKGMFIVKRTCDRSGKPCENACEMSIREVERMNYDDPNKIPKNFIAYNSWYKKGNNHRVENGQICRDMRLKRAWVIKIDNLMDLMAFINEHGDCIGSYDPQGLPTLEHYDAYREKLKNARI
jgi:hypothetical protein